EVRTEHHPQEQLSERSISQRVLRAQRTRRQETVYTVTGAPDAARTVVIEHPRRQGGTPECDQFMGETAANYRLRTQVPKQGSATVRAIMSRQEQQTLALVDADDKTLAVWSANAADEATRQDLQRLARLRRELADAQRQEQALDEQLDDAS